MALRRTQIALTGGEIFLNNDIINIASVIAEYGYRFRVFTNGSFPEKLKMLLQSSNVKQYLTQVHFSIDGTEPIHDAIRSEGSFQNAVRCLDICENLDIPVLVNTVIVQENIECLNEIKQMLEKRGISHVMTPHFDGLGYDIPPDDIERIEPFVTPEMYQLVQQNVLHGTINRRCLAGTRRCVINPDLSVVACNTAMCFSDGFMMGRLRLINYDFDRLWESDQADLARKKVASCRGCASFCES